MSKPASESSTQRPSTQRPDVLTERQRGRATSYLLGIDLGTTRTSAAVGHPVSRPGEIEVVNLGDRASAVPSVFYAGADGAVLVGEAAERRALTDPSRVVREFKRRIGDPTPLMVAGVPWSPQELSARVVRWVVDRVAEREGGPAARIAVTHPASWGPLKRELLGGALAGQGLQVSFLAEPQAAALHYASAERLEPGSTIAVYDLGGGTFDAAVVHKDAARSDGGARPDAAGFGLLGRPEGIERLGGIDFDQVVFDHVLAGMPEAFAGLDDTDPAVLAAVAAVRRECSEAKEALSSDTEVSIPVLLPGAQGSVRLHRSEFESMIRLQIEDTVTALRRAVASAGLTPDQLTAVLLVGGSSRIPLVGQLVSEQLGRPVTVDADPKNAIAMGAALSLDPAALGGTGAQVPVPRTGAQASHPIAAAAAGTGSQWPDAGRGGADGTAGPGAAALRTAGPASGGPGGPAAGGTLQGAAAQSRTAHGAAHRGRDTHGTPAALGAAALGSAALGSAALGATAAGGPGPTGTGAFGARPPAGPPQQRVASQSGAMPTRAVPPPRPAPPRAARLPTGLEVTEYDGEYDRPEPTRRRSPALLVAAGGIAAAVVLLGTVFLLPGPQPDTTPSVDTGTPVLPSIESSAPLPLPLPTTAAEEPAEAPEPVRDRPTRPQAPVTTAPPVTPTEPPPTTEPTPTEPPPTTEPTTPGPTPPSPPS